MCAWEKVRLGEVCSYATSSTNIQNATLQNYISTENLVADKGGKVVASSLPASKNVKAYLQKDILISNIRPYFKKIWFALHNGGCSNDVLVFRANEKCYAQFLYYALSDDSFFEYATMTAKGTKMPRGDKDAIMKYEISLPPLEEQKRIAAILSSLDDKIENNNAINRNLEEQAQALFKSWFVDNTVEYTQLSDYIAFNPKASLKKGAIAPFVEMKDLPTSSMSVEKVALKKYTSGSKFTQGNTLLARITPCLENGKTAFVDFLANREVGFGSTEFIVMQARANISTYYVYCLARNNEFRQCAIKSMVGTSGRQRVQVSSLENYAVKKVAVELFEKFDDAVRYQFEQIRLNSLENKSLGELRDTLLPKLMSGEIHV